MSAAPNPELAVFLAAQAHASKHRATIEASAECACFSCFARFAPAKISSWIDQRQTALCPTCGLDTVLGAASGSRIDDGFLRRLQTHVVGSSQHRR